jgi:uncharacterized protein (DUF58 family)
MSSRAAVVLVLFALSLVGGIVSGKGIFFNLVYLWGGLLLVSFGWSRASLAGIGLRRTTRSLRAQVGGTLEERLFLNNRSRFPKVWLEVHDHSDVPGHRASTVTVGLGPGHERTWLVRTVCIRRGDYRLGPATLEGGDPFGLFPVSREAPDTQQVVVMPMTVPLSTFTIPSGQRPGGEALRHRAHQVTPSAAGVRDYAPGDGFNRIHWPSTARRDRLIVKEFELDPKADIWIFLDASRQAQAGSSEVAPADIPTWPGPRRVSLPPSTEEYGVAAAASLALYFLRQDRAVGMAAYGKARQVIQPDRGERQLYRLLESLAVVRAEGWLSLEEVLKVESPQIPRGASLALISPSVSPGVLSAARQLDRRGVQSVLVLLDAHSFGGPAGSRALALTAQKAGLNVRLVSCGADLGAALSSARLEPALPAAA